MQLVLVLYLVVDDGRQLLQFFSVVLGELVEVMLGHVDEGVLHRLNVFNRDLGLVVPKSKVSRHSFSYLLSFCCVFIEVDW